VPAAHAQQEGFIKSEKLSHHERILTWIHHANDEWQMSFIREKNRQIHNLALQLRERLRHRG
jgi:hypothetical protein